MGELLDLCESAVREAIRLGAHEAEAYASLEKATEVALESNEVKLGVSHRKLGIGLRVLVGRSLGFAAVNSLDGEKAKDATARAVKIASGSRPAPHNVLPSAERCSSLRGIFDPEAEAFGVEEALEKALEMLGAARGFDARVTVASGAFNASLLHHAVANSNGVECEERRSVFSWWVMGMATQGAEVSSFDFQFSGTHQVKEIDTRTAATEMARRVVGSLGAKRVESFRGEVLLSPESAATLLAEPLAFALSSDNVQKGVSRFAQLLGQPVASGALTVLDDGTWPEGLSSSSFDREGCPRRPLVVIERGTLASYLYNTSTAAREGRRSTGHATGDFRATPRVGPSNLIFEEGSRSFETLLAETEKGILVTRFSGFPNPSTGDFSGAVKGGYLVRRGEIVCPVKEVMISGNVFEALRKVSGISRERKKVFSYLLPHVRVEDLPVTSGGAVERVQP